MKVGNLYRCTYRARSKWIRRTKIWENAICLYLGMEEFAMDGVKGDNYRFLVKGEIMFSGSSMLEYMEPIAADDE